MECSAAAVGWQASFGAPTIVESFTARIELLAKQSAIEFQMAFERRTGEKWERNNRHRRMTVSADRRRLDLFAAANGKLITRLQSSDSVLVYFEDNNTYVEAEVKSETVAYDLTVLHRYKLVCFTRFLLLRAPSTKVESVRSDTKKVSGLRKEIVEVRYKFANEQLSEICTVGIDPGTLNPLYSHSQIARDGSVITEDVEFLSIETDESRIAALLNWRVPADAKRVKEFRGGLPQ